MDISVVIPVYGCKAALPELHKRLTESLSQITDAYEIILWMIIAHKIPGRRL